MAEDAAAALVMVGVSRFFSIGGRRFAAVQGADLAVHHGELVVLLGRSGSGKTTLMSLAGALDRPDEGNVLLEGRDVTRLPGAERYRCRQEEVGWIFQTAGLLPLLTAVENVALALRIQGRAPAECEEPALEALNEVGLLERARHRAFELSGGEQQRVALARALVKRPRLILADEPTGQLDSETAHEMAELLRRAARDGAAVLVATHDEAWTETADRVITMEDGRPVEV